MFDEAGLERNRRLGRTRDRASLIVFGGVGAALLVAGVALPIPIVVFAVGLVLAVFLLTRKRARQPDRAGEREASELLASATADADGAGLEPEPEPPAERRGVARPPGPSRHTSRGRRRTAAFGTGALGIARRPRRRPSRRRRAAPCPRPAVRAHRRRVEDLTHGSHRQRRAPHRLGAVARGVGRGRLRRAAAARRRRRASGPTHHRPRPRPGRRTRLACSPRETWSDACAAIDRPIVLLEPEHWLPTQRLGTDGVRPARRCGSDRAWSPTPTLSTRSSDYEKLWPQPQVRCALGLLIENPACWRPSL